jgi:DoxX-like family
MKIIILWIARGIAAIIMLQTLYFKFSGAEESIYIFTTVGMEPWGRVGSGVAELIASLLILIPRTSVYGAVVGAGVMAGAIASHLFILGLEVMGDGGQLFIYACLVMISCLFIIWVDKERLLRLLPKSS